MEHTDHFYSLLAEAEKLLQTDPTSEEVIVVKTAAGNVYHCSNHAIMNGDTSEESVFLEMLKKAKDTTVCYLVCIWNRHTVDCLPSEYQPVDLPSFHFRQGLLALSPQNAHARILLLGNDGYGYKILAATMPLPKKP